MGKKPADKSEHDIFLDIIEGKFDEVEDSKALVQQSNTGRLTRQDGGPSPLPLKDWLDKRRWKAYRDLLIAQKDAANAFVDRERAFAGVDNVEKLIQIDQYKIDIELAEIKARAERAGVLVTKREERDEKVLDYKLATLAQKIRKLTAPPEEVDEFANLKDDQRKEYEKSKIKHQHNIKMDDLKRDQDIEKKLAKISDIRRRMNILRQGRPFEDLEGLDYKAYENLINELEDIITDF